MKYKKKVTIVLAILAAGLICSSAYGQEEIGSADDWQFSVTPYLWLVGIEGDLSVKGNEVDIDVGFDDIWDALDFAGQVHIEAVKGRWGLFVDPTYMALSTDKALKPATAEMELDMWVFEFGGFYRLGDWAGEGGNGRPMTLDILAGGRYWCLDAEVEIGLLSREQNVDWIDPFVGLRLIAQINDRLSFLARGDIGGFAVSSDASEFTWNVFAGPTFKLSEKMTLIAGYRALGLDRERGSDFDGDLTFHGPLVGLNIRF